MPKQQRNREWVSTRAKAAAAEAARRRQRRRRLTAGTMVGVLVLALVGAAAFVVRDSGSKTIVSTSANGKSCVPVADPLPNGAPEVPLDVGPPPTSLVTRDLKEGTGDVVEAGQTIVANYIGIACSTGKIFDSSYQRGQPATFPLDQVVKGWQTGIPGMKVGGSRLLGIPPDLAYGNNPPATDILPGETLWFVVDVVSISA